MKSKLIIVTTVIAILTNVSYGFEKLKTREDYEKIIKQQQVKIEALEKTVSGLKKQVLDLGWEVHYLKYGADSNEAEQPREKTMKTKQDQTIVEELQGEIERLKNVCRTAGIDPNSEPNDIQKFLTEE